MSQSRNVTEEYPMEVMLASSPQTTVYRAADPSTGRQVVVKILTSLGSKDGHFERQHFLRAMGAVQFLRLPAFPELYDFGFTEDQSAFMVMEWTEGVTLDELRASPPQHIIPILIQVVDALEALAMGEVFHHNLSPSNILVTTTKDGEAAKIVGFGTSAYLTESTTGAMLGHSPDSDSFIAPERLDPATMQESAGVLADIYSFALLSAEVLGGTLEGRGALGPTVRFDSKVRSRLGSPDQLEQTLSGALRTQAEDRTTTYPILRVALEAAAAEPKENGFIADPDTELLSETVIIQPPPIPTDVDETIVSAPPAITSDEAPDPDVDLDDTADSFDPNKTDPVIRPDQLLPPPIAAQPPPLVTDPPAAGSPPPHRKRIPFVAIAIAAAVIITLVIGGGVIMLLRLAQSPTEPTLAEVSIPTPTPATPIPGPAPVETLTNAALEEADTLLSAGNIEGTRSILAGIPQETMDAFTDEERELYDGIAAALTGSRLDAAISDLDGGLRHGSIRMLKRAVAGFSHIDPADYSATPEIGRKLAQAQAVLEIHSKLWRAHETGDRAGELEFSAVMIENLPNYSTPFTFRQEAAAVLEKESDAAAVAGDLDEAEKILGPISTYWPDREGLRERLATITKSRDQMETQLAVIEEALSRGWEGKPDAGLEVLKSTPPMPLLEQRFAKTRTLLEEQLAELDAEPPQLQLAGDIEPSFKKKKTVTIELVITDDYRVQSAVGFFRGHEETSFTKIPMEKAPSADRHILVISPEVHQNEDFFVYFEASDLSGHTARLGDSQTPLEFNRKKGLKALFSK